MRKLLLFSIVASFALLRLDILINLPIIKGNWEFYLSLSILNLVFIYLIMRKYLDVSGSLVSVFAYASSPLIAYYEFHSSIYLPLLTGLVFIAWLYLSVWKVKSLTTNLYPVFAFIFISLLILAKNHAITLYSDPGIENGLNQLRGESIKNNFGLESKFIENKYSYFGLHFFFNFITQFSPAVYFSAEYKILGFSFSPPLLFGFTVPMLIALISLGRNLSNLVLLGLLFSALTLPSVLSKGSPDLERLILAVPLISCLAGYGFAKIQQISPRYKRLLYLTFFILVMVQFSVIFFDITLREPIRLILLKS